MEPRVIERGYRYFDDIGQIRVMAVADGYAMCRRPRCSPFVIAIRDIPTRIVPTIDEMCGLVPDMTEGLSLKVYMDRLSDGL